MAVILTGPTIVYTPTDDPNSHLDGYAYALDKNREVYRDLGHQAILCNHHSLASPWFQVGSRNRKSPTQLHFCERFHVDLDSVPTGVDTINFCAFDNTHRSPGNDRFTEICEFVVYNQPSDIYIRLTTSQVTFKRTEHGWQIAQHTVPPTSFSHQVI
jgi:hypothetical protein